MGPEPIRTVEAVVCTRQARNSLRWIAKSLSHCPTEPMTAPRHSQRQKRRNVNTVKTTNCADVVTRSWLMPGKLKRLCPNYGGWETFLTLADWVDFGTHRYSELPMAHRPG